MNTIDLNKGKSMFHYLETVPGKIEILDTDLKKTAGATKVIAVNVIVGITGMHEGKMKTDHTLMCGPFSKHRTGLFEIVSFERRTHKGTGVKNAFFDAKVKMISKPKA